MDKPDNTSKTIDPRIMFELFNEIAIIAQLSRALFEARLPDGLLVPHFSVVSHLVRLGDGKTPLELARAFQVPKNTMTHTLSGLEKAGFITTDPNPEDKRSKLVRLTTSGRQFRDDAAMLLSPEISRMMQEIAVSDVERSLPFLRELRVYLDNNRPNSEPRK